MQRIWGEIWLLMKRKKVRVSILDWIHIILLPGLDPTTHIDNEYSRAGIYDPKIVITTSRDPSSKLLQFSKVDTLFYLPESTIHVTRFAGTAARLSKLH